MFPSPITGSTISSDTYNRSEVDGFLLLKQDQSSMGSYATITALTDVAALKANLSDLSDYAKNTDLSTLSSWVGSLNAEIANFPTQAQLSSQLSPYAPLTSLSGLAKSSDITSALVPFAKSTDVSTSIASAISPLATTSSVTSALALKANQSDLSTLQNTVSNLPTNTSVTSAITAALVPFETAAAHNANVTSAISGLASTSSVNTSLALKPFFFFKLDSSANYGVQFAYKRIYEHFNFYSHLPIGNNIICNKWTCLESKPKRSHNPADHRDRIANKHISSKSNHYCTSTIRNSSST